jgi:ribonucleoside-diphosphate reductase alpha chain
MGFAHMLFALGVPYNSKEGVELARKVMKFVQDESWEASRVLATEKGVFPRWKESEFARKKDEVRNVAITTIAPTGTISMVADTSSGIEPVFALSFVKNVVDEAGLVYTDRYFEKALEQIPGTRNQIPEITKQVSKLGSVQHVDGVPENMKRVFVTAHDIAWEWHVKMQAAFQEFCDNAVSKTINLPASASIEEVKKVYLQAWKAGCKGITVYRDQSKEYQVLAHSNQKPDTSNQKQTIIQSKVKTKTLSERAREGLVPAHEHTTTTCPECGNEATLEEGCVLCHSCGWSACSA